MVLIFKQGHKLFIERAGIKIRDMKIIQPKKKIYG
jgi:hypothetical protein